MNTWELRTQVGQSPVGFQYHDKLLRIIKKLSAKFQLNKSRGQSVNYRGYRRVIQSFKLLCLYLAGWLFRNLKRFIT